MEAPSQLLKEQQAKSFPESISQSHKEEPLPRVVSVADDPSTVYDEASNNENRNPQVLVLGVQSPGHKKVSCYILFLNILQANILQCEILYDVHVDK